MSEWREFTLGEIGEIFDGPHATPERRDEGPYFLNIASLKNGRLDLTASDHVDEEDFSRWTRRVTPGADDLLFSYETRLGEAALMPKGVRACLGRRMALFRLTHPQVHPRFMLYLWLSPSFKTLIDAHTIHGATVNRIPLSRMDTWRILLPPYEQQRAIAELLGALDDKIEANRKLAATAEDLARSCYAVAVSDLPRNRMSEILKPRLGATPKRSNDDYWGGGHPWVSVKDVTAAASGLLLDTDESISDLAISETRARPIPAGSVVLTARGTVGRVARLAVPASFNQSCYAFVPDGLSPTLLYFAVRDAADSMRALAHGSVFDTITTKTLDHVEIPDIRCVSTEQAAGIEAVLVAVENGARQNRLLATLRDTLLPKLMSGALKVREAQPLVAQAV